MELCSNKFNKRFGEKEPIRVQQASFLKNDHLKGADMRGMKQRTWAAAVCMAFLLMPGICRAGVDAWTWMSGSNTTSQVGVYGTRGMPDAANVPGAREDSISWTDSTGNMWLFGGWGLGSTSTSGYLNDLWRYEPATSQWTWVSGSNTTSQVGVYGTKGVPDAANVPGAREDSISWTDSTGNMWLFGGWGYGTTSTYGYLNDLWRYEPATNQWTWVSGSNTTSQVGVYGTKGVPSSLNVPGARYSSISWTDSTGNMWLFGGSGYGSTSSGHLNDLWRYEPATNQWTWMSGANTTRQVGVYGTKGVPDAANVPGAREDSISWTDSTGNMWLFGGSGYGSTSTSGVLNDLWRYDPATNQWTWISGANTTSQPGVYGTKGVPSSLNVPGIRTESIAWTDSTGNLWLFGGAGYGSTSTFGSLNDLWRYEPATSQWTWMSGSNTTNQLDAYGTRGVSAAANVPGARRDSVCWTDSTGNLWLFGGGSNPKNDLWRYELPQCEIDEDCDEAKVCRQQQCFETCAIDSDCSDGLLCNGVETCIDGLCLAGPWPCQAGQYCDEEGDRCFECLGSADCGDGLFCNGVEGCIDGECVAESSPCSGEDWCDEQNNRCIECFSSDDCPEGELCNVSVGSCVKCVSDADCDDGLFCSGVDTCVGGDCVVTSPCQDGEIFCDEALKCTQCLSDADCGNAESCKVASGVCVECYADQDCSGGYSCLYGICALPAYAQWTWVSGSNTTSQVGVYGTKGVPDAANVPGARNNSISWTDSTGNLWLFGGYGYGSTTNGFLNDLWRYDAFNKKWTWMSGSNTTSQVGVYGTRGVPDAANVPGARNNSISWTDSMGNMWLFGGWGYGSTSTSGYGFLNDLWRYEPATNQWTWMSGSNTTRQVGVYGTKGVPDAANVPGARNNSISWTDSTGNMWLFGGYGLGSTSTDGYLNDLWRYDPATNQWTWVSGSNTTNQVGVYGTRGVPDAANVPGARNNSISWTDSTGNLWLFGGSTAYSYLNDLWRYEPATSQWTWVSGSNTTSQVGVYGTRGVPDAANVPGGRIDSISWTDSTGNLWLFGGHGYGSTSTSGYLNDLWRYEPATSQWTWVSGSNTTSQVGVYGTRGVPDAANVPGARIDSISWTDSTGNLWLFGGDDYGNNGYLNDLWRYELPQCASDEDCPARYMCVEGVCEPIPDDPPVLTAGPLSGSRHLAGAAHVSGKPHVS